MSKNTFFQIRNLSNEEGEIRISGTITKYAWEDYGETSSYIFNKQLSQIKNAKKISVKLNSPGGDVYEALEIYHELKRLSQEKEITVYIDGIAASAASIIAIAGNKTVIGKGCYYMIHNPMMYLSYSDVTEMQKAMEILNKTKENILDLYVTKSSLTREEIAKKMDEETFFTAQEAIDAGFADEIATYDANLINTNIQNISMDLKKSKNLPKNLLNILNKKNNKEEKMTLAELRAQYPELMNQHQEEVINNIRNTDTIQRMINQSVEEAVAEERKRIQNLDNIRTYSQAARDIVNKAKFEEPRDYRDIIVDLYNLNSEQAGREIELTEEEKKQAGIYNIQSGNLGNSKEQLENNILNAALKELGIK